MRRRPEEDDQEQPQRRQCEVPGRRRIADQWWHCTGSAADDDVLRRPAFQHTRVDDDVEEIPHQCESGRQDVHRRREKNERERGQRETELERERNGHPIGGERTRARSISHQPVNVAVEHVVQRRRAAAREREAHHGGDDDPPLRKAPCADDEAAETGEKQQRHDAWLRQRHVVAPGCARTRLRTKDLRGHDESQRERRGCRRDVHDLAGQECGRSETGKRGAGCRQESPVSEPSRRHDGEQGRNGQRCEHSVRSVEAAGAAHDREERAGRRDQRGQAQPRPWYRDVHEPRR